MRPASNSSEDDEVLRLLARLIASRLWKQVSAAEACDAHPDEHPQEARRD